MKIGVLGTGMVGNRIAAKLVQLGYEVMMGSRTPDNEAATEWSKNNEPKGYNGTFEEAAKFGEIIILCAKGDAALDVLKLAKRENFKSKIVVDITNPLDFSKGMPPSLFVSNTNSLGEQLQRALPEAFLVKTLNIVSNPVMVDPRLTGGEPTMLMCGNNQKSKDVVEKMLVQFGWTDIIDLGDITNSRGMEMILPLWIRLFGIFQNPNFAFKVVRNK